MSVKKIHDVVVLGAGPSGINAAISAARGGMSVLLIDKNGYPGGTNTSAMVAPLMTFHAGDKQIIKGIAQEIIDRLALRGGTLGHIPDPIGMVSTITPIDSEQLKLVYFEMLSETENITTLLHTFLESVEVENDCIQSVTVLNKSGKTTYKGKAFIDATGDGDLVALCNVEILLGRKNDGMAQPMSLMFSMDNVDLDESREYVQENPEQFILNPDCDLKQYLAVSGFFSLVAKAKENGDFPLPRDRVLFFQSVHPGEVLINMTRVTKLSGVNAKDLTRAEFEAHAQVDVVVKFLQKYIPGFENARLRCIAPMSGVRESRRIVGLQTLTTDMVLNSTEHEDSVAICAFPIDIHDPIGEELNWIRKEKICCYDIPYGVMVPHKIDNLLVTGRCISASHEAIASARITATAMALGQAAGEAAGLAVQRKQPFRSVCVADLQSRLLKHGAIPGKRWL